ncbi:MAG TPA: crossover junction endodeoxyribonuclease RuvC [Vicinamibacteria bacterium]|nr:crossover junction endodeoxyribonuclease RuvC [Vicinamibacteria bacterium]
MRILGIDPGSRVTGYGAIDSDGAAHRLVEHGVIRTRSGLRFPEKLRVVHDRLVEVVERARPDQVVVEDLFYASNVKSALRLGHVRGVVILAAVVRGLPIAEYAPLEVKQAVVGYGRADKWQVQKMVATLLELEAPPEPHDAADALAVAICHAHQLRFIEKVSPA